VAPRRSLRSLALTGLLAGCTLAGCATAAPLPRPADVGSAQAAWPGTTHADLERGRTVFLRSCGGCHRLHAPDEVAPAKWPAVVAKMAPRAKLSAVETADALRYLAVLSAAGPRAD
jgi:hypothetical protein